MKPKKDLIERAQKNGAMTHLTVLLSAAYLLFSEANNLMSESEDLLMENGLLLGDLKPIYKKYIASATCYFDTFSKMFDHDQVNGYFQDLEQFDKFFREWGHFTPDELKKIIEEHKQK